jgi:fructosamine-3-kinase
VFNGYREVRPIDRGFTERRGLWRPSAWLAVVSVASAQYRPQLEAALRRYP